jgi:flavin reductase (DIM6/NTAB) family NADH-FMN oxidoreductase RutF
MQIDPAKLSHRDSYFLMISAIVPRPIAFVTTLGPNGIVNAAPFSYFTGVSSTPPCLLICSGRRRDATSHKDTHRNIVENGEFVVNVVVEEIMDGVVIGGTDHPPDVSEIEVAGLATAFSERVKPPRIAASPVNMECRLKQVTEVAGTAIIVGEVVWMHVRDDLMIDSKVSPGSRVIDAARLRPIARLGDDDYARLGEIFERRR